MTLREEKARSIRSNHIKKINRYSYKVKFQNSDKWYDVTYTESGFVCSCPYSKFKKSECKHKIALEINLNIRNNVRQIKPEQIVISPINNNNCKFCESVNIINKGLRKNKNHFVQIFKCKDCDKKFSRNTGFEKMRSTPEVITASMNLYFNGESLRHVADSMKLFGVKVTHQTIYNWIKKYIKLMDSYLESITPQVSDQCCYTSCRYKIYTRC